MKEELTRTELRRIAEEFKTERDAAKRETMRAFDERNILLTENMRLKEEKEKLEGELRWADAIIMREGNRNDALNACKARCEELREALREAERGFDLIYDAAEKGLIDEVLLHCGAHEAKISTTLFRAALKEKTK